MIKPHCPECKSTEKPHSKITGLKGVQALIVYCSQCGCMVGAVNYTPGPGAGRRDDHEGGEAHEAHDAAAD